MKMPQSPPGIDEVLHEAGPERLLALASAGIGPTQDGRYRHWDTLRHVPPVEGLTPSQWWLATKLARRQARVELPFELVGGPPFNVVLPDVAWRMILEVVEGTSGQIAVDEAVTNPDTRDRYVVSSLIEEAITTSQLEGASTTRREAAYMLRSGRPPRDRAEHMVLGSYRAMEFVRAHREEELTVELLLELHRELGTGSIAEEDLGRFQSPDEERIAVHWNDGRVLHRPPPAEALPARVDAMCAFANEDGGGEPYLPPVVRAIVLHFWLAYDHPFVDGNGRAARALFYWSMLRHGHWLAEFISISSILRRAPARYAKSFLYVETDDGDVTYFVLSQLRVVLRALDHLRDYLARKAMEARAVDRRLRQESELNHRQRALLSHAMRHPDFVYTYQSHARSHGVTHESARVDLQGLATRGLLRQQRVGRRHQFLVVPDISDRLSSA